MLRATAIHDVIHRTISLLPGPVKGQYFYLYMGIDIGSRRILGVEVHECECSELAKHFCDHICRYEGISPSTATVLHADSGPPIRSTTLAEKLAELGLEKSFSLPRISNRISITSNNFAR